MKLALLVSDPFRGIPFPNVNHRSCAVHVVFSFRPLPGYLISQSESRKMVNWRLQRFPSPSGVSHFSIIMLILFRLIKLFVSVPFRGISFLNKFHQTPKEPQRRFRPLPGYLISQWN